MGYRSKSKGITIIWVSIFLIASCEEKPKSPVIITTSITGISQTSAVSGGDITSDGGADITAKGVCWGTSQNPTLTDNKTSDGTGTGIFTSNLTSLTPKSIYNVRAYATNSAGTSYGNEVTFSTLENSSTGNQIIADHTIVADYDKIPQYYLDLVKKMWVTIPGESHSYAYQDGMIMVEDLDKRFQVNATTSGNPEAYTTEHLRVSNGTWGDYSNSSGWIYNYGEEDWWTNSTAIARTKAGITYCNTHSLTINAIGFGWCYDPYADGSTAGTDPVYGCHWWGWSVGSPSGDSAWGIDAGDYAVTGNDVSMDTYLAATQAYIDYCVANGYTTKVFFTTGPVDKGVTPRPDEEFYQAYLKYEHIRDYVKADKTRILFDYADILCYSNAGVLSTKTWNGITFPAMVPAYDINESSHVSLEANLRIGKALWWMLARIAGWDGK